MKNNKGKKILTAFLAGTLAVTGIIGGMSQFNATTDKPSSENPVAAEENEGPEAIKLNTYRFFDSSTEDNLVNQGTVSSYEDGYWAKQNPSQSYRPLWNATHTEGDKTGVMIIEPTYFRTASGKVAYCIDADKDVPESVTASDQKVSKKAYAVVKAGYPGTTGRDDTSDIELEWATTWAVKKVTGNTKTFADYTMSSLTKYDDVKAKEIKETDLGLSSAELAAKSDAEKAKLIADAQKAEDERVAKLNKEGKEKADKLKADAERIRKVAEELANTPEVEDYDKYVVDSTKVEVVHADGFYKVGPYTITENIGAKTTAKLVGAPANTTIVEDDGFYYVNVPEASVTAEISFKMEFAGDKQLLAATVYAPENDKQQRIYIYDMVDAKDAVDIKVEPELTKGGRIKIVKTDADGTTPLEGVEFVVYNSQNNLVDTITTNAEGIATTKVLPYGAYTAKESKALSGYILSNEIMKITINEDKSSEDGIAVIERTLANKKNEVVITKIDSSTKKPLAGAVLVVKDKDGNKVFSDKTDANGTIKMTGLAVGEYTYAEIEAPKGYALNNEKLSFEVLESGEIKGTLEIVDKPIVVELKKTDNDGKVLEGATFTVKNEKNETVLVGKTNARGILFVEKIVPGTYTVTETAPPAGYKINTKSFQFKVDEYGKVSGTTTLKDDITVITIIKKDKADGKVLEGAKITIKDKNGKVVADGTTGKDGKLVVKGLAPGTYVYIEDEAPEGYVRTNEKASFTINNKGEDVTLTLYNSKLNLTKKDSSTTTTVSNTDKTTVNKTTVNSKGEIVKTGVDDTTDSMIPVILIGGAAVLAVICVIANRKKKDEEN